MLNLFFGQQVADAAADLPRPTSMAMPPARPARSVSFLSITLSLIVPILASTLAVAAPFTPAWASMPVSFETPKAQMASMYRPVPTSEFAPFAQREWVNPKKPGPAIAEVRGLNLPLMGAAPTNPFTQTSWPNPGKPTSPIYEVQGLNLPLRGHVPFAQRTWEMPKLPRQVITPISGLNLSLQFVAAAGNPFVQTSWPNPTLPKLLPAPSSFRPVFTSEFQPFYQTQWPNPWKPPAPISEVRGLDLAHLPIGDPPFKQLTWGVPPRPIVPPPPSIYRPQAEQSAVDRPFVQTNWPNPIPPPRVRLPQPEQYFEVVYKPVHQDDWPLPWFPPPFKHDVIGPNLAVLHDMTNVPHPFVQLNWPLPAVPPIYVHPVAPWPIVTLTTPPTPNLDRLLYDVETGVWYMRLNATSIEIIRIT